MMSPNTAIAHIVQARLWSISAKGLLSFVLGVVMALCIGMATGVATIAVTKSIPMKMITTAL
jgi:hypothetical protein